MTGTLYLIPTSLGQEDLAWVTPPAVKQRVAEISDYVVEHPKTARHFLKQIGGRVPIQQIKMHLLNEHTHAREFLSLLAPLLAGVDMGMLSEAGCPAVADPGAGLVRLAHQKSIQVVPLVGPSSIMLALMASGLNGQRFAFHGYLPIEKHTRVSKLIELEKQSIVHDQTQIFIETPYRNQKLLELIMDTCRDSTDLSIASNLTLTSESVATKTIKAWKSTISCIHKIPAIFLLHG